jgi:hypothetical protein
MYQASYPAQDIINGRALLYHVLNSDLDRDPEPQGAASFPAGQSSAFPAGQFASAGLSAPTGYLPTRPRRPQAGRPPQAASTGEPGIGPRAVIRHAIVDENAVVPGGVQVGVDKQHDRARGLLVSPNGVTIVGKGQQVPP